VGRAVDAQVLGGKTFFFVNYEGLRYPNVTSYERQVPTATMRAGVITLPNSAGVQTAYNLNPVPVTVNGVTYQPAQCNGGPCDPRGLGLNSVISKKCGRSCLCPATRTSADGVNIGGFLSSLKLPQSSNIFVTRVDHDFGDKWKFFGSYRYYKQHLLGQQQTNLSPTGQVSATETQLKRRATWLPV